MIHKIISSKRYIDNVAVNLPRWTKTPQNSYEIIDQDEEGLEL